MRAGPGQANLVLANGDEEGMRLSESVDEYEGECFSHHNVVLQYRTQRPGLQPIEESQEFLGKPSEEKPIARFDRVTPRYKAISMEMFNPLKRR